MTSPASSAIDASLNTTVLGRYRIVRQLASGGMGAVYLGRTEGAQGFARPVVIKRILPTLMGDAEIAQLFVREAQILSNLQHPSIVSVLDFGQQEDNAYVMVLEYVHGYQVAEWLRYLRRTQQMMPVDFALHIVLRVLDALHYAHTYRRSDGVQLRIIHRDVSPSNVLLSDSGVVKLLDFGIARVSGDETSFKTEQPRLRGKMPYLALETFKGAEPSERSDLYSAAVMLFEMLTGFNPFHGRETADIYYKILTVHAPSVHASREDAPEEIDNVLARALAKDPAERYASAAEFAAALRTLRSAPEEVVTQRLSERLHSDFEGPMLKVLGIEPLTARETAWRSPEKERTPLPPAPEMPGEAEGLDPDTEPHNAVTVHHDAQAELLMAAARKVNSLTPTSPPAPPAPPAAASARVPAPAPLRVPAPALRVPPPAAHLPSMPAAHLPAISAAPLLELKTAVVPTLSVAPVEARTPLDSARRIALVVVLAAVVGAISAGAIWMAVDRGGDEPVVVIERESRSSAAAAPALNAALSPKPIEPVAPSTAVAAQVDPHAVDAAAAALPAVDVAAAAQAPAAPIAPPTATPAAPVAPAAPNPKRLTRAFGRRQKQIEECFTTHAQALQGQPQIAVHFRIGTSGQVLEAALSPEPLATTSLGRCLLSVANAASFGAQQTEVAFRIPITAQKLEQ